MKSVAHSSFVVVVVAETEKQHKTFVGIGRNTYYHNLIKIMYH